MTTCTCELNLGKVPLLKGVSDTNSEKRKILAEELIYFQGTSSNEIELKCELDVIRDEIRKNYFDEEEKVLAIPNYIPVRKDVYVEDDKKTDIEEREKEVDLNTSIENLEIETGTCTEHQGVHVDKSGKIAGAAGKKRKNTGPDQNAGKKLKKEKKQLDQEIDEGLEDTIHQRMTTIFRNHEERAFLIKSFNSKDCLQPKYDEILKERDNNAKVSSLIKI